MAKEISENTVVGLSLKTIGGIIAGVAVVTIGYFDLKAEIELAKELPPPEVGRMEYDLKDQLVRETIMNTQKDVEEIKHKSNRSERAKIRFCYRRIKKSKNETLDSDYSHYGTKWSEVFQYEALNFEVFVGNWHGFFDNSICFLDQS